MPIIPLVAVFAGGAVVGSALTVYAALGTVMKNDILRVAAKDLVSDAFTVGIERAVYGESRPTRSPYNRYRRPSPHYKHAHVSNITFESNAEKPTA